MSNRDQAEDTQNKSPVLATYQLHAATPKIVFFDETMLLIVEISRSDQESFESFVQNQFNRTETVSKSSLPFNLPGQKKSKFTIEIEGEGLLIKENIRRSNPSPGVYTTQDFNVNNSLLHRRYFSLQLKNYADFNKKIFITFLFDGNLLTQIGLEVDEIKTLSIIGRILRFIRNYQVELTLLVALLALVFAVTGPIDWTPDPPTATPTYTVTAEEPATFTPDATGSVTVTSTVSTETPVITPTIPPSLTPDSTLAPTSTPSLTNSATFTPTITPSLTPSATFTPTLTPIASVTRIPPVTITLATYQWNGNCISLMGFGFPIPFNTPATDIELEPVSQDDWEQFRADPGSNDIPPVTCKDKDNIDRYNISVYWSADATSWLTTRGLNLYPSREVPSHISAYEAMAYCRWNAMRTGRSDGRLPTLEEWQKYYTEQGTNFKYAGNAEREWLWKSDGGYQHLINPANFQTSDEDATTGDKDLNDMIFRCAYTD